MKKLGWIVSPAPFLLTRPTVSRMSVITACTILPHLLLLASCGETAALLNIAMAVAGSVLADLFAALPDRRHRFGDGTAIISGLCTGLLLPSTLNPAFVLAITCIGLFTARVVFGGPGSYWMNPVAAAVCIAFISQGNAFPQTLVTADGIRTMGNAFGALKVDHFAQLSGDPAVTNALNTGFLRFFGIKVPEGYMTLLWDSPSVIPAFRFNIVTLAGSIVLIAMNIIDWIIPLCFLGTYSLSIWFFSLLPFAPAWTHGDILFALLTSGTLFVAFYVLPEYTTTPRTRTGKVVSGIFAGLACFCISGPGGSPAGGVFTVVFANAVNPVIEYLENRRIDAGGTTE